MLWIQAILAEQKMIRTYLSILCVFGFLTACQRSESPAVAEQAVKELSRKLLTLQGDGDYAAVQAFVRDMGTVGLPLQADLDRLASANIPVDIGFEQGADVLGL